MYDLDGRPVPDEREDPGLEGYRRSAPVRWGNGAADQAGELYASLCARASPLGLLSEQIDPSTGAFIGNFPQAFSHIGVIASGVTLARALGGQPSTAGTPA